MAPGRCNLVRVDEASGFRVQVLWFRVQGLGGFSSLGGLAV